MKKKSINVMDFGHLLGRDEMKKIMAGCDHDGGGGGGSGNVCYCYCCTSGMQSCGYVGRLGGYGCSGTGTSSWCTDACRDYYSCSWGQEEVGSCQCC